MGRDVSGQSSGVAVTSRQQAAGVAQLFAVGQAVAVAVSVAEALSPNELGSCEVAAERIQGPATSTGYVPDACGG